MTMKNRKTVIAVFLVLALMLVAVGYAAITGSLTIEGTVSNQAQKFNVVFTAAKCDNIVDSENDNAVPALHVQNTKMEKTQTIDIDNLFTVSMTAAGLATTEDLVQVTFTIKNNNKVDMKLTPSITETNTFSVEDGFGASMADTIVVAAEGETTYTVIVKLVDDGLDLSKTETFTITIAGASVTE